PVSPYVYEEMNGDYCSTFTLNGQPTGISAATTLGGSTLRRIELVAAQKEIPVEITGVEIAFSVGKDINVVRGSLYSFVATVTGTGAYDNTVAWSVEGGGEGTKISASGMLTVAENETASTLTIKAVANGDSGKFAAKTVDIYTEIAYYVGVVKNSYFKKAGETVSLTAEAAADGYHFKEWQTPGAELVLSDKTAMTVSFTVPTYNVTMTKVYELHSATSATWLSDSTKHWHVCSCGAELNAAPHAPDREAATETEPVSCTECGYIMTPALGHVTHVPGEDWLFDNVNHWHKCTGCNQKFGEAEHTFGEWTVTVQPEVGVAGEKERSCSVCEFKETEQVEALKETFTITVEGGKVNGETSVTVDKDVVISVIADDAPDGKRFKGWSKDGGKTIVSENSTYLFGATENVTLNAVYEDIVPGEEEQGSQPEKTVLSGGAIAGIAVASVAVVGIGAFSVVWFVVKKKTFADLIAAIKALFVRK
ncbi:MAG: InlB B-repeat-containing protein, partial [Candidatus Neoclostridium sp.]